MWPNLGNFTRYISVLCDICFTRKENVRLFVCLDGYISVKVGSKLVYRISVYGHAWHSVPVCICYMYYTQRLLKVGDIKLGLSFRLSVSHVVCM